MALAIEPETDWIYVSAGAVWSAAGLAGRRDLRSGDRDVHPLQPRPEPARGAPGLRTRRQSVGDDLAGPRQVVRFTDQRRGELMLEFDADVDSMAFGQAGTDLDGLLFVSHNAGANDHPGSELTMVDVATLRRVTVADGGSRGDVVITTSDGRVLVSQSHQVDVLNPAHGAIGRGHVSAGRRRWWLCPLTYSPCRSTRHVRRLGQRSRLRWSTWPTIHCSKVAGEITLDSAFYDGETHTVLPAAGPLEPDDYRLSVDEEVAGVTGLLDERRLRRPLSRPSPTSQR